MRKRTVYTILLISCIIGFWVFENFYTPATYSVPKGEDPRAKIASHILPSSTTGVIVEHTNYSLSYNETYEQAEWVAYALKKNHLTNDDRKRPYFIEDPKVRTKSADWRNYRGSGYDRGHLCPAGDRRFSEYAYKETFYTSNISPQNNDFNAGIWNRLEQKVRYWAKKYDNLFVITAGVLEKGLSTIGDEDVAVPEYYYKIVFVGNLDNPRMLGFLMPHKESTAPLQNFVVPIDEIEHMTGIDFFGYLPDSLEKKLESTVNLKGWVF
ncbi:MAG: DNA/RNA non-specific endonuclease [Bacteroidota bacterium]